MGTSATVRNLARLVGTLLITLYAARASAQATATPRPFDGGNSPNPWPYPDWASGEYKAQCNPDGPAFGLSAYGQAHSLLCESPFMLGGGGGFPFNDTNEIFQIFSSSNSASYGNYGDWDYGYYKGDCPADMFIVGMAQTPAGALDHVICAWGKVTNGLRWGPSTFSCRALTYPGDNPSSLPDGDWASGYYKLECDYSEVMVSVSADTSAHHPQGILCCPLIQTGGH